MSDAKPWTTSEWADCEDPADAVTPDGNYMNPVHVARTLATCRQRDEMVAMVRELVEALDMAAHSEECSRTEECDDERGHNCDNHERACPSCDCGVDRWQASAAKACAVLAKWGGK